MENDTGWLVKLIVIISAVAVFAISLNAWDPSAPTVAGWANLQTVAQADPFAGAPAWPNFGNYTTTYNSTANFDCTGNLTFLGLNCLWNVFVVFFDWVIGAIFWIGGAFLWFIVMIGTALWFIGLFFVWLATLVIAFFGAIFGAVTLTFPGMPPEIQALMWIFIVPALCLLIFLVIRLVRGQS